MPASSRSSKAFAPPPSPPPPPLSSASTSSENRAAPENSTSRRGSGRQRTEQPLSPHDDVELTRSPSHKSFTRPHFPPDPETALSTSLPLLPAVSTNPAATTADSAVRAAYVIGVSPQSPSIATISDEDGIDLESRSDAAPLGRIMSRSPLLRSLPDQDLPTTYDSVPPLNHVPKSRASTDRINASVGDLSIATSRSRRSRRVSLSAIEGADTFFASGVEISSGVHSALPEGFVPIVHEEEFSELGADDGADDSDDEQETDLENGGRMHNGRSSMDQGSKHTADESDPPDNSIYPQVRASVSATDDHTLSISTPRMWFLSMLFALLGSATNLFFSLRYPSVNITPVIALILVHPLGLMWDSLLKRVSDPEVEFENGIRVPEQRIPPRGVNVRKRTRLRLWLAQGRWNEKEHACVYISSNVAFGFAFATDVIVEQRMFYKQEVTVVYQLLLTISTQILGYAFAGLTRRYLVRPPSMIWPGTLMSTAMFTTLHKSDNKVANGWRITRWRFFVFVWVAAFAWYFVPGLLMPALSYFNVLTWFAPDNVIVSNLFGVSSGLGLFPVTFDWAQIAYIGSPLLTPWWAAANVFAGLAIVMWIIAPICYYSNTLFSAYMPILSSSVFDNTGKIYDVSKILTSDFLFDERAFRDYSPIYMPITYALSYGVQFAALTALVTHTVCWYGKDIIRQTKESFTEKPDERRKEDYQPLVGASFDRSRSPSTYARARSRSCSRSSSTDPGFETSLGGGDVHNRLMSRYDDAPLSWYLAIFLLMLALGIFIVKYYPIHLPIHGLLLALSITTVMFLPVAIVMAITNQHSSLYLTAQIICGYVFPGRPVANMVFTTYAYISSAQGIKFSSDLKLGHYMKIPPRILFAVQMAATVLSSFTQIGVLNWMFAQIPGICTPEALNGFNCPLARVHFNGSILWGVVGPGRFFGRGGMYGGLVWFFALGAVAPVLAWLVARRRKDSWVRMVNFPLLFGSLSWIPPATGLNFSVWALVCYIFNYRLRRGAPAWWGKYTMTMSAALDSGLAFGVVVAFFCFLYPGVMDNFRWWGTEVYKQGCDWQACPLLKVGEGEHFGNM